VELGGMSAVVSMNERAAGDGLVEQQREAMRLPTDLRRLSETSGLLTTCLGDVEPMPVRWLWRNRIPSKLTVIAGPPGMGKSQITLRIAATVSTGGSWPDGTPCEQGSVLMVCGEDDPADTILPRLMAAGGDPERVHMIDAIKGEHGSRPWCLEGGTEAIEMALGSRHDVRLIVIDPITAYYGRANSHSSAEVRALLAPLMRLADHHQIAVVVVTHLNKGMGLDSVNRITGSNALPAASRITYVVGEHPHEEDAYCIAVAKSNLSPVKTGIGYRVVSDRVNGGIETSKVEWMPGHVDVSGDELLSQPRESDEDLDVNSAKGQAAAFLLEQLRDGAVATKTLIERADEAGIAEKTLRRAKDRIHVRATRPGGRGPWVWQLPTTAPTEDEI
jgi:RecA/RadA recombinase